MYSLFIDDRSLPPLAALSRFYTTYSERWLSNVEIYPSTPRKYINIIFFRREPLTASSFFAKIASEGIVFDD